jgi:hypothetical protein
MRYNSDNRLKEGSHSDDYAFFLGRSPKIRVPTRTLLLPSFTACTKSALMPMLSSKSECCTPSSLSMRCRCCRVSFNEVKSGFGFVGSCEASHEPIVIKPSKFKPGQDLMTCNARVAIVAVASEEALRGSRPDLASSPEVLTCI